MKTSSTFSSLLNIVKLFIPLFFVAVVFNSCGDDDSFVNAQTSSFTFDELNMCDIGGTVTATRFTFTIDYDASEGTEIEEVRFDIDWSSGDSDDADTGSLTDTGSSVEYSWCYRFGSEEWVRITHTLVTADGKESNTSVVQIDKPSGAN